MQPALTDADADTAIEHAATEYSELYYSLATCNCVIGIGTTTA